MTQDEIFSFLLVICMLLKARRNDDQPNHTRNLSGFRSRRIDDTNRFVYVVDDDYLTIISRRYHLGKAWYFAIARTTDAKARYDNKSLKTKEISLSKY